MCEKLLKIVKPEPYSVYSYRSFQMYGDGGWGKISNKTCALCQSWSSLRIQNLYIR